MRIEGRIRTTRCLTRIYGVAFGSKEELAQYLKMILKMLRSATIQEDWLRDGALMMSDFGPGSILASNGMALRNALTDYA